MFSDNGKKINFIYLFVYYLFGGVGVWTKSSCFLGRHSTLDPLSQPQKMNFNLFLSSFQGEISQTFTNNANFVLKVINLGKSHLTLVLHFFNVNDIIFYHIFSPIQVLTKQDPAQFLRSNKIRHVHRYSYTYCDDIFSSNVFHVVNYLIFDY